MLMYNHRREVPDLNYQQAINQAILFIQQHLKEPITMEDVANHVGYSTYHFQRLFKSDIGMTLYDYLRKQRLRMAAVLLTQTNQSVLDIALTCHFQSQESFSRAFKELYSCPPHTYRCRQQQFIQKGVFIMTTDTHIRGWFKSGSQPEHYDMSLDKTSTHLGAHSLRLTSVTESISEGDFGAMMQQFKAADYQGKRVKLSGFIRTNDVTIGSGLWMRMDSIYYDMLGFDNMQDRPIKGNTEWHYYESVLDVPHHTDVINIGVFLEGTGTLWWDHIQFNVVPSTVPTTGMKPSDFVPDGPENLSLSL